MPRLLTALAVTALTLAPALATPAFSGTIPTKLDVSGDDSTLNYQITTWAIEEIKASKTHAVVDGDAPVLQVRIAFASIVRGETLAGVALAILVSTAEGADAMRFISLTNQVVPLAMFEDTVRSEIRNLLK